MGREMGGRFKGRGSMYIYLWKIDGETVETVSDFIFLGSKITADGDCSHEIKRRLLVCMCLFSENWRALKQALGNQKRI